ncbi:hypothetical protein C8R44DRAFT_877239 [Mycena epipterygia]|nr:hypothetical protein C8R44DRAFT_877239 [Mycena epipterygia]
MSRRAPSRHPALACCRRSSWSHETAPAIASRDVGAVTHVVLGPSEGRARMGRMGRTRRDWGAPLRGQRVAKGTWDGPWAPGTAYAQRAPYAFAKRRGVRAEARRLGH